MKNQTTAEEIQLGVALFEGRSITLAEAKKIQLVNARRSKMLARAFNLSAEEVSLLCANQEEVSALLREYCWRTLDKYKEKMREIEARAIKRMRDPRKAQQMKALLSVR